MNNKCYNFDLCSVVCPTQAISHKKNYDVFYEPIVKKELCTECGLCNSLCIQYNSVPISNGTLSKPIVFGGWSKDSNVQLNSSSGGIFTELAKYVIENNGAVFGAVQRGLEVEHIWVCKSE